VACITVDAALRASAPINGARDSSLNIMIVSASWRFVAGVVSWHMATLHQAGGTTARHIVDSVQNECQVPVPVVRDARQLVHTRTESMIV
jgi:hypothetical protein